VASRLAAIKERLEPCGCQQERAAGKAHPRRPPQRLRQIDAGEIEASRGEEGAGLTETSTADAIGTGARCGAQGRCSSLLLLLGLVCDKPLLYKPTNRLGLRRQILLMATPIIDLVHEGLAHAHLEDPGRVILVCHVMNINRVLTSVNASLL
jgi:hypothetical protein